MSDHVDSSIVAKAKTLGVRPDLLRDAAWIQPIKGGNGRNANAFTHVLVVTYSSDFVKVRLPQPARTLLLCCSLLEYFFGLVLLALDDDKLPIIYVNREATLKKFDLDPSDHFSFDRIAFWMQEQTAKL